MGGFAIPKYHNFSPPIISYQAGIARIQFIRLEFLFNYDIIIYLIKAQAGTWLSWLKRCPHMAEIEGSNPSVPTTNKFGLRRQKIW